MTASRSPARPRIDPRILDRRVGVTRAKGRRRLRVLLLLVLVSCLAAGAGVLAHSSLFSARHVRVVGEVHTPVAGILSASGLGRHPPLVDVDPGLVSARLEQLPWVDNARVLKHWPDSVTVLIRERTAVATIVVGDRLALVDGTGRVLAYTNRAPLDTVALVDGSKPRIGAPGSVLGAGADGALVVAKELPEELRGRVQAVEVGAGGWVTLELGGEIRALFGPATEVEAKFEALASVLEDVSVTGPAQINLTVPNEPTVQSQPA